VGAVARHESELKSERSRRQRDQMALAGKFHGGKRAFGYQARGGAIDPAEAAIVREIVERVLAGDSLRSVGRDLDARGVRMVSGGQWRISSLRLMLTGARIAGLRVHRGEVIGEGGPAIITRDEHEQLVALLGTGRRVGRPPLSLLAGLLRCGVCGRRLHHSTSSAGRRYVCAAPPHGCGRLGIMAEPVERLIVAAVFRRVDDLDLAGRVKQRPVRVVTDEDGIEARLRELAELFAAGDVTRAEWLVARNGLEERLNAARSARAAEVGRASLAGFAGTTGALSAAWGTMSVDQRRAVLGAMIDRVVIAPGVPETFRHPEARVSVEWSR
jgi:site-specific DNA recombinase